MKVFMVIATDTQTGEINYGNKSDYLGGEKCATVYTKPAPARALRTRLNKKYKCDYTVKVVEYELTQTSILDD